MVNKAAMIEKIADLVKAGSITGISDIRDESDRDGMRVVIELRRDAQPRVVLNQLYKHTQMQTTFGANLLALEDNRPRVLTCGDCCRPSSTTGSRSSSAGAASSWPRRRRAPTSSRDCGGP